MRMRVLADALLAALVAPSCAICGRVLDRPLDGAVCASCLHAVDIRPSAFVLEGIAMARAIGPYDGTLRALVHALKYDGRRSVAPLLARLMAAHGADLLRGADCTVPVPLHRRRQRQRGFNQSEELTRHLGLPSARLLARVRWTTPQVELPAGARRSNVSGAFALSRAWRWWPPRHRRTRPRLLDGRVVVLVDDVATTGATLEACARVLKGAGAAEVRALTAARALIGPR